MKHTHRHVSFTFVLTFVIPSECLSCPVLHCHQSCPLLRGAESSGVWVASWLDQRIVRLITVFGSVRWGFPSLQMDLRSMMKECAMKEGSGPISDPNVRLMLLTKGVEHRRRFPTDWLVRTVEDVSSQLFTPYMKSDLKSCAAAMMKRWGRCVGSAARPGNTSVHFPSTERQFGEIQESFRPTMAQSRDLPRW